MESPSHDDNDTPSANPKPGPTVAERHIDFLLEEEFNCNPSFLSYFVEKAASPSFPAQETRKPKSPVEIEVSRSSTDMFGEADLIVIYSNKNGARIALLIEDKIRAAFQPGQAERYQMRGESGKGNRWDSFWTCLVAPNLYIGRGHQFHASVQLEAIRDFFESNVVRGSFKSGVIKAAIEKANRTGVQVVDPVMTEFRGRYFALFTKFFESKKQHATTRPPADTYAGDTWWHIKSEVLPRNVSVYHKAPFGAVDLAFNQTDVSTLQKLEDLLETDMSLVQTGHSASIRVRVPEIKIFNDFDQEIPKIEESLGAVSRLILFFQQKRQRIEVALSQPAVNNTGSGSQE